MNKFIPLVMIAVFAIVGFFIWASISADTKAAGDAATYSPPQLPPGRINDEKILGISDAASYSSQLKGAMKALEDQRTAFQAYRNDENERMKTVVERVIASSVGDVERRLRGELSSNVRAMVNDATQAAEPKGTNRVVALPPTTPEPPKIEVVQSSPKPTHRLLEPAAADIPQGFGFDNLPTTASGPKTALPLLGDRGLYRLSESSKVGYIKVSAWQPQIALEPRSRTAANGGVPAADGKSALSNTANDTPKPLPVFTIENTATLFSNTTMTALLGVVPTKNGALKYPMRFKVISGADNIASNGLYLPEIRDVVWTGFVFGNREMECVQAIVDTITFTFQDGTIRTVESKQKNSKASSLTDGLGYLSDRWGKPCIRGTLISNASQYLRDRMIAAGAAATASASAATQTTVIKDTTSGATATAVTGSQSDFIVGQTGTATLTELADYLRDRMDQAVDIIYLDAGKEVVIHVEDEIQIDYDPVGRKLSHIAMRQQATRSRLD